MLLTIIIIHQGSSHLHSNSPLIGENHEKMKKNGIKILVFLKIINLHPLTINGFNKSLIFKSSCGNKGYKVPKQTRKDVLKPNLPSYNDGQCLCLRLFQWTCLIADL